MGLIKAAISSIGSVFGDQWLDAVKCEDLGNEILMKRKIDQKGRSIISKGSRIIVNPGQIALIVDNGAVKDATAEPGAFTFDDSTSPSFFGGDFGPVFKEMWERFKFGGAISKQQAVYFFNAKEILDNKFGTATPIPYSDWGHPTFNPRTQSLYGMAVNIRMYGKYTFKINNPFELLRKIAGNAETYSKSELVDQMTSEFLASMQSTLNLLGTAENKIPALDLPSKSEQIVNSMHEKSFDEAIKARGIEIVSVAVQSVSFDDESKKKIDQYELSDPLSQSAYLAHSQGEALKNAASNPSGGGSTMMGMGIGFGAMGVNPMSTMQQGSQNQMQTGEQIAAALKSNETASSSAADTWKCICGAESKGKFCTQCGAKRPESKIGKTWKCACGAENSGKFCSECGAKMPPEKLKCSKCGAELEPGTKFCPECGAKA
ncbi:MAG: SPFH domain-containing protein [Oscillospiraceae bacterium]|nr:SPFH domain-containing protein [Oscillospiraceae bacterium]